MYLGLAGIHSENKGLFILGLILKLLVNQDVKLGQLQPLDQEKQPVQLVKQDIQVVNQD